MSYVILDPRGAKAPFTSKINLAGEEELAELVPVDDIGWYLMDSDADLYLRLKLKYFGPEQGMRKAFPVFISPGLQESGPLNHLFPGGRFSNGLEPLHEAWDRRDTTFVDIWDSCFQEETSTGNIVPAGNGDYFRPARKTYIPAERAFYAEKKARVPNLFKRLLGNRCLGFEDGDDMEYKLLRSDARAQTIEFLRQQGFRDPHVDSVENLLEDMEFSDEKEVEAVVKTHDLAVHKFDFQFSKRQLPDGAWMLYGVANEGDEFNKIEVRYISHNQVRMFKIFKKLNIPK